MARPKNTEKRGTILTQAHRMFIELGYRGTSYAGIAEACDVPKNVVQSFFARKEQLIVAFFERLGRYADEYLVETGRGTGDAYLDLYVIGQIEFLFLTSSSGARSFFLEILNERSLTGLVNIYGHELTLEHVQKAQSDDCTAILDAQIRSLGGEYEFMYYRLSRQQAVDPAEVSRRLVEHSLSILGEPPRTKADFDAATIPNDKYADTIEWFLGKFYQD